MKYDERFRGIVGDFGGKTGMEFVENAGETSHYDEVAESTKLCISSTVCGNVVFFVVRGAVMFDNLILMVQKLKYKLRASFVCGEINFVTH